VREDLRGIRGYIAQFNPFAAERVALALLSAAESLIDLPERGRAIGQSRRELGKRGRSEISIGTGGGSAMSKYTPAPVDFDELVPAEHDIENRRVGPRRKHMPKAKPM